MFLCLMMIAYVLRPSLTSFLKHWPQRGSLRGQILKPRDSGHRMLHAQSSTIKITWAISFLSFITRGRNGIGGKAHMSPEFHLQWNASLSERHIGNATMQKCWHCAFSAVVSR